MITIGVGRLIQIELDDELIAAAQAAAGIDDVTEVLRVALCTLIERESARRLARLGGAAPGFKVPQRRRRD